MNKNRILPIVGIILLIGALAMTLYFKSVEKKIERENKSNLQKSEVEIEKVPDIIIQEEERQIEPEDFTEIEGLETIEDDLLDLESLINDPVLEEIDSDLSSF